MGDCFVDDFTTADCWVDRADSAIVDDKSVLEGTWYGMPEEVVAV